MRAYAINWSRRLGGVGRDTLKQIQQAQLSLVASSLAYTTILSIIPALAVSFAIFKAFGGLAKLMDTIQPIIFENLAEGADEQALAAIKGFVEKANAGALGVGGVIGLIFTTMSMLNSAENAINRVWNCKQRRSLFRRVSSYWLFITLGPLALSVAIGFVTSEKMPLTSLLPSGAGMMGIAIAIFFLVYRFVPTCEVNWQFALISAVVTSGLWNLARAGYSYYLTKAVTYNKIYGSLGAVPILLLWIYILWIIVLVGAALNAALQRRFEDALEAKKLGVGRVSVRGGA